MSLDGIGLLLFGLSFYLSLYGGSSYSIRLFLNLFDYLCTAYFYLDPGKITFSSFASFAQFLLNPSLPLNTYLSEGFFCIKSYSSSLSCSWLASFLSSQSWLIFLPNSNSSYFLSTFTGSFYFLYSCGLIYFLLSIDLRYFYWIFYSFCSNFFLSYCLTSLRIYSLCFDFSFVFVYFVDDYYLAFYLIFTGIGPSFNDVTWLFTNGLLFPTYCAWLLAKTCPIYITSTSLVAISYSPYDP